MLLTFIGEDLLLNAKAIPEAKKGDIVEIYHPEDQNPRLLLQIKLFKEDLQISNLLTKHLNNILLLISCFR